MPERAGFHTVRLDAIETGDTKEPDVSYATFTEQWKAEDTRCTSCGRPLYSRWWWMSYRLWPLRHTAHAIRVGRWSAALFWLRKFDARAFVRGI